MCITNACANKGRANASFLLFEAGQALAIEETDQVILRRGIGTKQETSTLNLVPPCQRLGAIGDCC